MDVVAIIQNGLDDDEEEENDSAEKKAEEDPPDPGIPLWEMLDDPATLLYLERRFRHPWVRVFFSLCIIPLNFWMYSEDPVAHSKTEASVAVAGISLGLFADEWCGTSTMVRLVIILAAFLGGLGLGRLLQRVLRIRMAMFADDQGTFMCQVLCLFLCFWGGGHAYNALRDSGCDVLSDELGFSNLNFMRLTAVGCYCGDALTFFIVMDTMMQDASRFPAWIPKVRRAWKEAFDGKVRIIAFWVFFLGSTTAVMVTVLVVSPSTVEWDDLAPAVFHTGELGRCWLAAIIMMFDVVIVMQDWEFPTFKTPHDVLIPGFHMGNLDVRPCGNEHLRIVFTGKWLNYGVLLFVMGMDANMYKNQVLYHPSEGGYGQCALEDEGGAIFSFDEETVRKAENNIEVACPADANSRCADYVRNPSWCSNSSLLGESSCCVCRGDCPAVAAANLAALCNDANGAPIGTLQAMVAANELRCAGGHGSLSRFNGSNFFLKATSLVPIVATWTLFWVLVHRNPPWEANVAVAPDQEGNEGDGKRAEPKAAWGGTKRLPSSKLRALPSTRRMEEREKRETELTHDQQVELSKDHLGTLPAKAFDPEHEVIATTVSNRRLL